MRSQLAAIRQARGLAAADLAKRVGISRQTIYAIEAGAYVPNTEVALRLSRQLEVPVEELFSLAEETPEAAGSVSTEILSATTPAPGQPVRICRAGSGWISVPVSASPYYLPEADGVISAFGGSKRKSGLVAFSKENSFASRIVLAGCDPATGLLARVVEKASRVEIVTAAASSKLALEWLSAGKVHIAGSHLEDTKTGQFNVPFLRRRYPREVFKVITFARWEVGLVVAPGNPKRLRKAGDLGNRNVVVINREQGSGSRMLLDRLLSKEGVTASEIQGYNRVAYGHLAAAYAVSSGEADCCLATRAAARAFGLDFEPLHTERYDLVFREEMTALPTVQAFLDVLQRAALRRKLDMLAGYDTAQMGAVVI